MVIPIEEGCTGLNRFADALASTTAGSEKPSSASWRQDTQKNVDADRTDGRSYLDVINVQPEVPYPAQVRLRLADYWILVK